MVPGVALPVFQILAAERATVGTELPHPAAAYSSRLNSKPSVLALHGHHNSAPTTPSRTS